VHEDILVGTQPQTPADVDFLKDKEGVTCIMNTQQSKDWKYWNVDFAAVAARCEERDVHLERRPFPDFDSEVRP
jgi:atypical dual specificity phosphatase